MSGTRQLRQPAPREDAPRPGHLTRLLLRVMGPADVVPPDAADRRAQLAYRRLHGEESVETVGPSPHGELSQIGPQPDLVPDGPAAREPVRRDLAALAATRPVPQAIPAA